MKTLRYLLSMIALVSVLSLSAQTPNYGKPYKGQETQSVGTTAQLPAATMGSVDAGYMQSGSNLPMAAQSGVVTTYDKSFVTGRPRRAGEDEGFEDDDDPDNPGEPFPLGDMMWPMMMLALAYAIYKVSRMRRREEGMLKR